MGDEADYVLEQALMFDPEWEPEREELPPLPRYRSKRVLPKGLQKHSNRAFDKCIGVERRHWYWLWLK